jgi:hypothetical protein
MEMSGSVMSAQEIGTEWLNYVTETFLLQDGSIRADVQDEYRELEESESFKTYRELWRTYTDELIEKILQCPAETRGELLAATDRRSLAYVQDRIHCGTDLLTTIAQKGLQVNLSDQALPDFFRQILLQR